MARKQSDYDCLLDTIKRHRREFTLDRFRFESGESLDGIGIEYSVFGSPKRDERGKLTNAILFCHGWRSDYTSLAFWHDVIGPGKPLDTDCYCIVSPTSFGVPGSLAPSNSGLGANFPRYSMTDRLGIQYRLLNHLGIEKVRAVIGNSFGGTACLEWITRYPDSIRQAIIVAAGADFGRVLPFFSFLLKILRSDPGYMEGRYTERPLLGVSLAYMAPYPWLFSADFYASRFPDREQIDKKLDEQGVAGAEWDANDVVWDIECMLGAKVNDALARAKAHSLVLGIEKGDTLAPLDEAIAPLMALLPNSELFTYASELGHLGSVFELGKAGAAIEDFLKRGE